MTENNIKKARSGIFIVLAIVGFLFITYWIYFSGFLIYNLSMGRQVIFQKLTTVVPSEKEQQEEMDRIMAKKKNGK